MNRLLDAADIIETKLQAPQLRHQQLSRSELIQGLAGPDGDGLVMTVVAPAGSGKSTTLVELYQTLSDCGFTSCWLSVDADDNEPVVFAKYLVASLCDFDFKASEKELALIKANPTRDFDSFFDQLLTRLTRTDRKLAIFIDDFQHLTDPCIVRFWNRFIAHAPHNVRIGLASRARLPLDLGRRRIAGSLKEITQRELNFNTDQVAQFMQQLHAIQLDEAALKSLYETTEGWAAGLQLVALAIGRSGGRASDLIASFSGRNKDLTEYLFQTVLRVQSEDIQRFLLLTSPLGRLSPGLCKAVCESDAGATLLDKVERSNLFLIPLDHEGRWFRYHHLFADFLQAELQRKMPQEHARVCRLAAQWSERQGRLTEAVRYCLAGELYDRAADLIAEKAPDIAQFQGDHYTILDWMRRLPEEFHNRRPEIHLNHAWSRAFSRDLEQAISLSERVKRTLDGHGDIQWDLPPEERASLSWLARIIQVIAYVCADNLNNTLDDCVEIRAELPDSEAFLSASILNATSYCHLARGELSKSVDAATQAYSCGRQAGSNYALVWADFLCGLAHVEQGRLQLANEKAERAIRHAGPSTKGNRYVYAMAAITKAEVETQRGQFASAGHSLQAGQEFSNIFGPRLPLWTALRNEARVKAWQGELGAATEVLRLGQDTALGTEQPLLYFSLVAEEIDLSLRHDQDLDAANSLLSSSGLLDSRGNAMVTDAIRPAVQELARWSEIKLLLAQGRCSEAQRLLTLMSKANNMEQRQLSQFSLRALRAITQWKSGRNNEAERELDRLLMLAAPDQVAYPILSAGREITEILESTCSKRNDGFVGEEHAAKQKFEQRLLYILKGESSPESGPSPSEDIQAIEALTEREQEILKLVSAGLANQQLSDELLISIATVKWHLHNIYEKFGVRSRSAAAAFARQHKLI